MPWRMITDRRMQRPNRMADFLTKRIDSNRESECSSYNVIKCLCTHLIVYMYTYHYVVVRWHSG